MGYSMGYGGRGRFFGRGMSLGMGRMYGGRFGVSSGRGWRTYAAPYGYPGGGYAADSYAGPYAGYGTGYPYG